MSTRRVHQASRSAATFDVGDDEIKTKVKFAALAVGISTTAGLAGRLEISYYPGGTGFLLLFGIGGGLHLL